MILESELFTKMADNSFDKIEYFNQLDVLDFDELNNYAHTFTLKDLLKGGVSIAEYAMRGPYKNKLYVDYKTKTFNYKDKKTGIIITDYKGKNIIRQLFKSIEPIALKINRAFIERYDMDTLLPDENEMCELKKCIRHVFEIKCISHDEDCGQTSLRKECLDAIIEKVQNEQDNYIISKIIQNTG